MQAALHAALQAALHSALHALQAVLQVLQAALQAALHAALQAGQADVHVLAELLLSLMEYQHFHEFHWNACQSLVTILVYNIGLVILLYTSFVTNTWFLVICTPALLVLQYFW